MLPLSLFHHHQVAAPITASLNWVLKRTTKSLTKMPKSQRWTIPWHILLWPGIKLNLFSIQPNVFNYGEPWMMCSWISLHVTSHLPKKVFGLYYNWEWCKASSFHSSYFDLCLQFFWGRCCDSCQRGFGWKLCKCSASFWIHARMRKKGRLHHSS